MITRRTFFESLAAVAAGLVLPEPRRVRAYSFMPGIGLARPSLLPRDVWHTTTRTFTMRVYAVEGSPFILGGQPVEIGDRVAIDARDPSRVYRVPRVRV